MTQKRSLSLSEDDTEIYTFLKKVKVEHETINDILKKKHPEIDIEKHELYKFLTIFNALSRIQSRRHKKIKLRF